MRSIGIDIGGSRVKAALLEAGREVGLGRSGLYKRPDAEVIRSSIAAAVRAAKGAIGDGRFDAVGVCAPGLFDPESRSIARSANVPGLEGVGLDALVAQALGAGPGAPMRVTIDSDALAAAHDVVVRRGLSGRVLGISLGTGVGAAVLDDGVPLHVSRRSPGHMGQWDVTLEGEASSAPVGPDGGRGGLEAYIGLGALVARFGPEGVEAGLTRLGPADPALRALARAIRIAHAMYRPDHVLLLGGVGMGLRPVHGVIDDLVRSGLTSLARPEWMLSFGDDEFHAARGAALLAQKPNQRDGGP